jgi:hypothetical protein
LLENGKLAYIDEIKFYLKDFMKEKDARGYFRSAGIGLINKDKDESEASEDA